MTAVEESITELLGSGSVVLEGLAGVGVMEPTAQSSVSERSSAETIGLAKP